MMQDEARRQSRIIHSIVKHLDEVNMEEKQIATRLREIAQEAMDYGRYAATPAELINGLLRISNKLHELANEIEKESK